jgi:hypothetical protein
VEINIPEEHSAFTVTVEVSMFILNIGTNLQYYQTTKCHSPGGKGSKKTAVTTTSSNNSNGSDGGS